MLIPKTQRRLEKSDSSDISGEVFLILILYLLAFSLLLLSQVVFIFTWLNTGIYVVAEVVQLAGFTTFLINMLLMVLGHGKKKN